MAIQCGVDPIKFWQYTFYELYSIIEQHKKCMEAEQKNKLIYMYNVSAMTASFVGLILNGKPIPDIDKLYPDMEETKKDKETIKKEQSFYIEQLKDFAYVHNKNKHKKQVINN